MLYDLNPIAGKAFNRNNFMDYGRAEEEFQAMKRQKAMQEQMSQIGLQKAQRDLNAPQLPFQGTGFDAQIANEAYKFNLGKGLGDAAARQKAVDMVLGTKSDMRPSTDPYTGQTTFQPTPRNPMFGEEYRTQGINHNAPQPVMDTSQAMPASAPMQPMPPEQPIRQPVESIGQPLSAPPMIDPRAMTAPDVQKGIAEEYGKQTIQNIFENQNLNKAQKNKQQQFEMKLNDLIDSYGRLILRGDYKTELPENATISDLMRNVFASVQAGELGQKLGGSIGTSTATAIEGINTKQPMVFGELRELLGMTGREMDTQKERDFYMNIISKPSTEISTTLGALNDLSMRFGTGQASQRVQNLMSNVSTKKDIQSMSMQEKVQRVKELRAKAGINAQ